MKKQNTLKAPKHLKATTRAWWERIANAYEVFTDSDIKLLTLAAESLETVQTARAAIKTHGLTYNDRFGAPHPRPETSIARDAQAGFARIMKQLKLDDAGPPARPDLTKLYEKRKGKNGKTAKK